MATITLSSNKINQMPGLIKDVKKSVNSYKSELFTLKSKALTINNSVCNMDDVISSIQSSSQTQEQKVTSLDNLSQNIDEFVSDVVRIDGNVADTVNQRKDNFYDEFSYLKPECEKSGWEKFKDGCKKVAEWCKEHWKLIGTILIVIAAIAIIVFVPAAGVGLLFLALAKGAIAGAVIGGIAGGVINAIIGRSFWAGVENGAFAGAIAGIISGGMGFAMSTGGTVALGLGKTVLIGAVSGLGSSLIGDLGDKFIKSTDISWGQMFVNMAVSGTLGAAFAGIGYGLSKGFTALKVKFGGKVTPLENGPYIKDGKPNGRPGPTSKKAKLQFEKDVYKNCVSRKGILRDPNTREVLGWKPGQPRKGVVDFGHKPGKTNNSMFLKYKSQKITLNEYKSFNCNSKNFRIEAPSSNRSHLYEKSFYEIIKIFPWSSSTSNFIKEYVYEN